MKKGLFVIALVKGGTKRVKGYDVTKEAGAPVDVFAYKRSNRWVLTDKKTGFAIKYGKTRKEVVSYAKNIDKTGWEFVMRAHKYDGNKRIIENVKDTYSGTCFDENVKAWYQSMFPKDEEGNLIDEDMTFSLMFHYMTSGFTFKSIVGTDDSLVRERLFNSMADRLDWATYEDIYDIWLESADHEKAA